MAKVNHISFKGVNLNISPLNYTDGELLACQNLDFKPDGAVTKRTGYKATGYGEAGTTSDIRSLHRNGSYIYAVNADGSVYWVDKNSGTQWAVTGTNTLSASSVSYSDVFNGTFFIGDNGGTQIYTADGTSFTPLPNAPKSAYLTTYNVNQRMFSGSGDVMFWSKFGDATNYSTTGTADSSSIKIPGGGDISSINVINNNVLVTKTSGLIANWDGFRLTVYPSNEGALHGKSVSNYNGLWIWINQTGFYATNGVEIKKISRPIDKIFKFVTTPTYLNIGCSWVHRESYYYMLGLLYQFDLLNGDYLEPEYIPSVPILKYDIPYDRWSWYDMPYEFPAYGNVINYKEDSLGLSYTQLEKTVFADTNSRDTYVFDDRTYSDNGNPIHSYLLGFLTWGNPSTDKLLKKLIIHTSPGCNAKFQVAFSNKLSTHDLQWEDCGDLSGGVTTVPGKGMRGKYMFYKLNERSTDPPFTFYGFTTEVELIGD